LTLPLFEVASYSRDITMFYFNDAMKSRFFSSTTGDGGESIEYQSMITVDEYWAYLQNHFFDRFHAHSKEGYLIKSQLIGPPRLRQIRVRPDTCQGNAFYPGYLETCYGEYSIGNEEVDEIYQG